MGDSTMCSRFGTGHCGQVTLKSDQEPAVVDVLSQIANLRGSRGTLLRAFARLQTHSRMAVIVERGIRSAEEMARVILFDLSSRIGSLESLFTRPSRVFPWIVEHATDTLKQARGSIHARTGFVR